MEILVIGGFNYFVKHVIVVGNNDAYSLVMIFVCCLLHVYLLALREFTLIGAV